MALLPPTATRDNIPSSLDVGEETDFTTAKQMFKSFEGKNSNCFVFAINEKKEVNINELHQAPKHWIIKELEQKEVRLTVHYLSHMLDLSTR